MSQFSPTSGRVASERRLARGVSKAGRFLGGRRVAGLTTGIVMLFSTLGLRALVFEVTNGPDEVFEQVVSTPVVRESLGDIGKGAVFEVTSRHPDGILVASALDTSGPRPVLTWVLPGITAPGDVRRFVTKASAEPMTAYGDLRVMEDAAAIRVGNSYFELQHRLRGGGGFPHDVTFPISGHRDRSLHFLDRLFRRDGEGSYRGQYLAESDSDASARVVFKSPVRVVIESRTRFVRNGQPAPGEPRAVYRYVYSPFSPVVQVETVVERKDQKPWNELHFLHVTRDDYYYTSFVTGDPPKVTPMQEPGVKSRSVSGSQWAVMATAADAVGVGGGPVTCWDASDEFVYYIVRQRGSWTNARQAFSGSLYFGPSSADGAWFARWLSPAHAPSVRLLGARPPASVGGNEEASPMGAAFRLENAAMRISFAGKERGYACIGIDNLLEGPTRFVHWRDEAPGCWRMILRTPHAGESVAKGAEPYEEVVLDNTAPADLSAVEKTTPAGKILTFRWRNLDIPGEADCIDVTATVLLAPDRGASEWRIEVANRSTRFGLWELQYPFLSSVCLRGTADVLQPRGNWGGTLIRQSRSSLDASYPSAGCPVQFMAFNLGSAGLYVGSHDGEARPKRLVISPNQDVSIAVYAENMGVPGSSQAIPFPIVIAPYRGDWWTAARLYRSWATRQIWARKGWIAERDDVPRHLKEIGLWWLGSGFPDHILSMMEKAAAACPLPIGLHWYNWHKIPFDNSYPNYFPTKPGFAAAVHRLTAQKQVIMPYINGRLWDRDIPSFAAKGVKAACKQANGEVYTEIYGSKRRLSPMCPATRLWQDTIVGICHRLMHECGVNAIYLDQIGAARPRLCFDPHHGHPLGGGHHWVDGYRTMLSRIKADAVTMNVGLTTENTAEPYMDNIDAYLAWVQRNDTDVPLLPAVYSGYTLYFTSPQDARDDFDAFVMAQGRDFLWGCQLGWNSEWLLAPEHRRKLDFELDLCAYHLAGKEFMVYGQLLDAIRPTNAIPLRTTTWNRSRTHSASLPAVQGTLWRDRAGKRLAVFMVNMDRVPHRFTYSVSTGDWLKVSASSWLVRRLTPRGTSPWVSSGAVVRRDELLAPGEIRAFLIEPMPADARVRAEAVRKGSDSLLARCADEFLFADVMARSGLSITPPAPLRTVVRGEPVDLGFSCTAGDHPVTLAVEWPDGGRETLSLKAGETRSPRHATWLGGKDENRDEIRLRLRLDGRTRDFPVRLVYVPALGVTFSCPEKARAGESMVVPLQITNNSSLSRRGRVWLQTPPGWKVEPSPLCDVGVLAPGDARGVLVKCTLSPAGADTRSHLTVRVIEDAVDREIFVRKSRPRLRAPQLSPAPVIDGKLDDWPATPPLRLGGDRVDTVRVEKDYGGAEDLSATVRCGWDKNFLYLAAKVRDNVWHQEQADFRLWQGDCIQLAFRDGPPNDNAGYDGTESEVGLTLGPAGPVMFQWSPGACPVADGRLAVRRDGGVTIYEAAIPWKALGIRTMREGRRLAWSFTINDNDGAGFRGWLEWTPGICGGKDSSAFGWFEAGSSLPAGEGNARE